MRIRIGKFNGIPTYLGIFMPRGETMIGKTKYIASLQVKYHFYDLKTKLKYPVPGMQREP